MALALLFFATIDSLEGGGTLSMSACLTMNPVSVSPARKNSLSRMFCGDDKADDMARVHYLTTRGVHFSGQDACPRLVVVDGGGHPRDGHLVQGAAGAGDALVAVLSPHDQLAEEGVVVGGHLRGGAAVVSARTTGSRAALPLLKAGLTR